MNASVSIVTTVIDESNIAHPSFSLANYRQLAELRFRIRQYLQFSEQVARTHGIEPQQHQLMLAIKGLPANAAPTVSALANRLCLRHHSTVELINRLVERGAALRKPCVQDRRQVLVELTPEGEELLAKLHGDHTKELQTFAPELREQITTILTAPMEDTVDVASDASYETARRTDAIPESICEPILADSEKREASAY